MTPIRIVCANTEFAALRLAKGANAQRTYTIRHLGNMSQKIAEARNVLDVTINFHKQFKETGDRMALIGLGEQHATTAVRNIFPVEAEMGDRAAKNREEAREAVMSIFRGEGQGGDTRGESPDTVWTLYNSLTEYADWYRGERKDGGRWQRSLDDADGLKAKSWEVSLELAGLKA